MAFPPEASTDAYSLMPVSEDDRDEDLKPEDGCHDRHETQAEVEQNRVTARGP